MDSNAHDKKHSMSLAEKQKEAVDSFNAIADWPSRYNYLINLAKDLPPMPDSLKVPINRVQTCTSKTYIAVTVDCDRVYIHGYSNAQIPAGIIQFARLIFDGCHISELKQTEINFHTETSLTANLTANRLDFITTLVSYLNEVNAENKMVRGAPFRKTVSIRNLQSGELVDDSIAGDIELVLYSTANNVVLKRYDSQSGVGVTKIAQATFSLDIPAEDTLLLTMPGNARLDGFLLPSRKSVKFNLGKIVDNLANS